jgi:serine/threonine-protein kinase
MGAVSEDVADTERAFPEPISGKYRVERVLGEGGMGVILEATHLQLEERVALKVLRPELARDPELVQRFVREARAAIKIRSEHVVRILDVASLDSGAPYIVMELLQGTDLERLVKKHGPLPPAVAVDYVLQACEALAEAHALGMVHRDLKPANLFLTQRADGTACVKVLDFGITKVTDVGKPDLGITNTQAIFGSPKYMSPEQMRSSRTVDARSDVWALGTILFELMAGASPFDAESMPALCAAVINDEPARLPASVPQGLAAVVMKCLRKRPEQRFQDVGELATALTPYGTQDADTSRVRILGVLRSPDSVRDRQSDPGPVAPSGFSGVTSSAWGRDSSSTGGRGRRLVVAFTAGVLVLACGVVAIGYRLGQDTKAAAPAASPSPRPTAVEVAPPPPLAVPPPPPATTPIAPEPVVAKPQAPPRPAQPKAQHPTAIPTGTATPAAATTTTTVTTTATPTPTATATSKPSTELFDQRK